MDFYTLNCFKQSAKYFLMSESVPGMNFRLRWVRCLNGLVSITFNTQVVLSPLNDPWEMKCNTNLKDKSYFTWDRHYSETKRIHLHRNITHLLKIKFIEISFLSAQLNCYTSQISCTIWYFSSLYTLDINFIFYGKK